MAEQLSKPCVPQCAIQKEEYFEYVRLTEVDGEKVCWGLECQRECDFLEFELARFSLAWWLQIRCRATVASFRPRTHDQQIAPFSW